MATNNFQHEDRTRQICQLLPTQTGKGFRYNLLIENLINREKRMYTVIKCTFSLLWWPIKHIKAVLRSLFNSLKDKQHWLELCYLWNSLLCPKGPTGVTPFHLFTFLMGPIYSNCRPKSNMRRECKVFILAYTHKENHGNQGPLICILSLDESKTTCGFLWFHVFSSSQKKDH